MTDKELLEKAAKAADVKFDYFHCVLGLTERGSDEWWNPLTDDGDALQMAVKLEIEVRNFNGESHAGKQDKFWCTEKWFPNGDALAATRLAITRAAAAMVKE